MIEDKITKTATKSVIAKTATTSIAKHIGQGGKILIQNVNPLQVLREYVSYRKVVEEQKTERERIISHRDIAVKAIESEKGIILKYFELCFAERKSSLSSLFDILHQAVENKDEAVMDSTLSGILEIVKDNPLKDFATFRNSRLKGEVIEI